MLQDRENRPMVRMTMMKLLLVNLLALYIAPLAQALAPRKCVCMCVPWMDLLSRDTSKAVFRKRTVRRDGDTLLSNNRIVHSHNDGLDLSRVSSFGLVSCGTPRVSMC